MLSDNNPAPRVPSKVTAQPTVTVVILGWFGAKQRHLKKYADWYNERGINTVTFSIPVRDVFMFRAEQRILELEKKLSKYMKEPNESGGEKQLLIHAFCNTGWLSYGVMLERWIKRKDDVMLNSLKGCVIDSAPASKPDPNVYASGISTALTSSENTGRTVKNAIAPFVNSILQYHPVQARLNEVTSVLTNHQPRHCPQLYMYSAADKIIPSSQVESFMLQQDKVGKSVQGVDFRTSPHVSHLRHFPTQYSSVLDGFIQRCLKRHKA